MSAVRAGAAMQLPPHQRTDGAIEGDHWYDVRVPAPLRTSHGAEEYYAREDHEPRVAGHSPYVDDACHDGRHLFDIIESVRFRYLGDEAGDEHEEQDFRARLTCVRCGTVRHWEGTRTEQHVGRVQAAPLVAGDLVAQQTSPDSGIFGRDVSTWTVYRDGAGVGRITWASGPRGRAFFTARLDAWPAGDRVEGDDPAKTLRKIHRHDAELAAPGAGA